MSSSAPVLVEAGEIRVHHGDRVIVDHVSLDVAARGIHALAGPPGAGKSTLLRVLAGRQSTLPPWSVEGRVCYRREGVGVVDELRIGWLSSRHLVTDAPIRALLVEQLPHWRQRSDDELDTLLSLWLEAHDLGSLRAAWTTPMSQASPSLQRLVHLARVLLGDPELVCLDEVMADLSVEERAPIEHLLALQATRRAFLMVTHHRALIERLASALTLMKEGRCSRTFAPASLAGGGLRAAQGTPPALSAAAPEPPPLRRSALTSGTWKAVELPSLRTLAPDTPPAPPAREAGDGPTPEGFTWLLSRMTGSYPLERVRRDPAGQLAALRDAGITLVVTLDAEALPDPLVEAAGLLQRHVLLSAGGAPDVVQGMELCRYVEACLDHGHRVAYLSAEGAGRAGTLLLLHLIGRGMSAEEALEFGRMRQRTWVQSDAQERLLFRAPVGFLSA